MFPCEACGHPLNLHNPCTFPLSRRKKTTASICGCPQFQPPDLQARVAALTDIDRPDPVGIAAAAFSTKGKK